MTVTKYMWDPDFDTVMKEEDEFGVTTAKYDYEPVPYGRLISQNRDGETSYYHFDGLGSTTALTDENGDVTDTYEYDAWGNATATTGSTVNPFLWVGELGYYYEAALARHVIRVRLFDPMVSRWTSVEPLWPETDQHRYAYALNNPTRYVDASGLTPDNGPPPPPLPEYPRSRCCCCVNTLAIKNISEFYDPMGEINMIPGWGHEFDVVANLTYRPVCSGRAGDCKLEWFECTDLVAGVLKGKCKPNEWCDSYELLKDTGICSTCNDWSDYLDRSKPYDKIRCPGSTSVTIHDFPRTAYVSGYDRTLYFAIRVSSTPGCCDVGSITIYATQTLKRGRTPKEDIFDFRLGIPEPRVGQKGCAGLIPFDE